MLSRILLGVCIVLVFILSMYVFVMAIVNAYNGGQ